LLALGLLFFRAPPMGPMMMMEGRDDMALYVRGSPARKPCVRTSLARSPMLTYCDDGDGDSND
jgi:hypothetical protein